MNSPQVTLFGSTCTWVFIVWFSLQALVGTYIKITEPSRSLFAWLDCRELLDEDSVPAEARLLDRLFEEAKIIMTPGVFLQPFLSNG